MADTTGAETAKIVSGFINSIGPDYKGFVETMGKDHPTLQQSFTQLCLEWIKFLAERDERYFDGRNEASKKLCDKIKGALSSYEGDVYWHKLPTI